MSIDGARLCNFKRNIRLQNENGIKRTKYDGKELKILCEFVNNNNNKKKEEKIRVTSGRKIQTQNFKREKRNVKQRYDSMYLENELNGLRVCVVVNS